MERTVFLERIQSTLVKAVENTLDGSVRGEPCPYPAGRQHGVSVLFDHDEYGLIEVYAEDRDENCWHKTNPNDPEEVFGEVQTGISVQRHNGREDLADIPSSGSSISVRELSRVSTKDQEKTVFQDAIETSLTITMKRFQNAIQSEPSVVSPSC